MADLRTMSGKEFSMWLYCQVVQWWRIRLYAEDVGLISGSRRSSGIGNGNPLQYFLSRKFNGQRSLVGYSPWCQKDLDMTKQLSAHTHTHTHRHNELTRSKYFWSQLRFWKTVLAKKALAWTLNQIRSVAQSCPTLCDPMNCSMPGLPVHHQLQEFTQTHLHRVSDTIQPSHPLSSPSPPAPNPSQHQSLFQWVTSSHEVAKVLEFQL